jgi:nitroreductase
MHDHDLERLIRERHSTRMPFAMDKPVPREDLDKILEAARWTPTAHNMQNFQIVAVDDRALLDAIGQVERPISEAFIRENYRQLSFSPEELAHKKRGILASVFPPSWLDPDFTIDEKTDHESLRAMQRPLPAGPLMLVVLYDPAERAPDSEGDFLGIISLGCLMENLWLMAASLGIGMHIISSLGAEPVAGEVKKLLHIPPALKLVYAVRLGYPASLPREYQRVRRELSEFVHHNIYQEP